MYTICKMDNICQRIVCENTRLLQDNIGYGVYLGSQTKPPEPLVEGLNTPTPANRI